MFNITNHQGNANQMSYHLIPVRMPLTKKQKIVSVEKLQLLSMVGGNVKCYAS